MSSFFSKQRITAAPGFNRWRVPPASIAIHLCIGSVYAWSIFNPPLTRLHGVVLPAPDDWTLKQVVWVFTVAIVFLGLSAALAGRWLERVGPRLVGTVAACCWGGGFLLGALGIHLHELWLLYLGYGVLGGCGLGLGYVSPVSTLIKWFPDRRGMAAGMAIMGFGGGAMIAAPLKEWLISCFRRLPENIGMPGAIELVTREGRRFAEISGDFREVVVVGATEATESIAEGVYLVGTGDSGVAASFLVLGISYFIVMVLASFSFRVPALDWTPEGFTPPEDSAAKRKMISRHDVGVDEAMRTPQFYLLWVVLCLNVTAGIGVLGVAKTMMVEIFGTSLPHIVDAGFAGTYVVMISVFNMLGRFVWASASDHIGRKRTYTVYLVLGMLLYLSIPWTAHQASVSSSVLWLVYFYAATMIIFTMYGGGFATIPAYLSDLFGSKYVGAVHGRLLTAWSTAGVLGPLAITSLRERALGEALTDLAGAVEPLVFEQAFGQPLSNLEALMEGKILTIPKLLELAPPGTPDPSSTLYSGTMYLMVGLLAVALVANLLVRPVDAKHHAKAD